MKLMSRNLARIAHKWNTGILGYPERTSGIECGIPAAGDHLISRLEAAPTERLSNGNLDFPDKQAGILCPFCIALKNIIEIPRR